jgi:fibro-slime domain-containing protein/LPXTG-motif cell wall-anchored protein
MFFLLTGTNPNEEDTMLADDLPDNDVANTPDTIADTGASQGFIPATATIYFEDDGRYDSKLGGKCTIHFHACTDSKTNAYIDKVMADTGETVTDQDGKQHKIFSVTLNSADYPAGGFYRIIFQYMEGNSWKEEINAFGNDNVSNTDKLTAIDLLAGKKLVSVGITNNDQLSTHFNQNQPYNPAQWARVEYYYKGTPLYFKNASNADLANVTAVFYKKGTDGTVETTTSLPIGTVEAGKFYAQKILIPDNQSQFVQFTWDGNGESDLYNFSTDPYDNVPTFDLTKTNCFVYSADSTSPWQSADSDLLTGGKIIYFDATLSSYGYDNEGLQQQPMPGSNNKMYCLLTDSDGNVTPQEMKLVKADSSTPDPTPDRQLWSCKIPDDKTYTEVQFSAVDSTTTIAKDNKTKKYSTAEIPPTLQEPCFFADDGDPSAYTSSNDDVFRDGYWGEKKSRHNAESGKSATIVDIDNSGKFTQQAGTKYITSTLYDYYTDYELNGLNRDSAPTVDGGSQRGFVTFEQFDRALSSAYTKNKNVKYPLYTGHFEPTGGGAPFAGVADGMKLCGWGDPNGSPDQRALYNTFMAVNNSTYDDNGHKIENDYSRTFQGLVEDHTSDSTANGLPLLRASNSAAPALVDPHFNEDFLQGENSFNTVLGKVYKDVSFPFTKDAVFKSSTNPNDPEQYAQYWYYDSSKASLYLKQDKGDGKYYLESPKDNGKPTTHANSKNINASSGATHGFFPFNQTVSTVGASQYNYGFGAKLQFDFTLTEDGNVVVKDASGNNTTVPIKFFFSGDDDVWVYIDGKLVLDVGGAHGKASGLLEFGASSTVTPYVSSNKNTDTKDPMVYTTDAKNKTVYFNQTPITFTKTTKQAIQLDDELTTHTLTMFYMERGMWDSNMAVAFNFPDSNELQVEKEVNLTNVNVDFKPLFQNQKLFTFTLQNLATHYGPKTIDDSTPKPVKVGSNFTASSSATDHTIMEQGVTPSSSDSDEDKAKTVKWYAQGYDKGSQHRDLRYGTMTLDSQLDISKTPDYLSFDVYAVGNTGDGVLSTNYLYLTLVDSNEKQMGCDANGTKSYLNTMLSGSVVMQNNQWVTVKLQLNKMPGYSDFDLTKLSKILIGDDYERTVYFRNFVFTAKPVVKHMVGFSVEQADIPDYGSVENNTLKPASGAIFTSSVAGSGAQAVDTDGTFDLQKGETVTFTDQFRRGSYISLQETENTALYDTRWEVYENGTLVNAAGTSPSVNAASPLPLQGDSTKPEDNRTETADSTTGSNYNGNKPANAKTLVFRSYAAPEEEFPKLKVRFINTVKVGTLVIEKKQANDGSHLTGNYEFTVIFSNVGGIGLGGADGVTMTKTIPVDGSCTITGIPIGTRFQVVEKTPTDGSSSLQSVTCNAADAQFNVVDNGVRGTVTSETEPVTATFTNTAHQLMDITVEKKWLDADNKPLTDNLPNAIWVKLQRHRVDDTSGQWEAATDAVELKYDYMSKTWTHKFERLDKTDVTNNTPYEYRVAECATQNGTFTAKGTVTIGTYTYTASQTDLTDGKITLTNKRTDPNFALNLTKKGIDGENTPLLDGVEFKLEKLKDDNTAETTDTRTTGSDGTCSFTPLSPGKYRLTETKTAAGYTLLAEPIEFTLTADGQCQRDGAAFGSKTTDADGVCNIALTIYNRKGFTLPHTGADAPSLWLLIGLPALVAVLLVLVFRYNKKGGKHS